MPFIIPKRTFFLLKLLFLSLTIGSNILKEHFSSRMKKEVIVFLVGLSLVISVSYPSIYLPDEWITANQLNHIIYGTDPLHGFEPYGGMQYGSWYSNILVYTLALPVFAYSFYHFFSHFNDTFRLVIIFLDFLSFLLALILIEFWFRKYSHWRGIPWTYLGGIATLTLLAQNLLNYTPFVFYQYGEVAALIFTNHIAFAFLLVFVFKIFRETFKSDFWGIFGIIAIITSSSYLFWAGNAKDHELTFLFIAVMSWFYILYIEKEDLFALIASFISIGWLTWVRPELGAVVFIGMVLLTILFSVRKGVKSLLLRLGCSFAFLIGAIPLFINNFGLTGNPFKLPWLVYYSTPGNNGSVIAGIFTSISSQFQGTQLNVIDGLASIFGIFIKPGSMITSGIFQVSPLSVFGILLIIPVILNLFKKPANSIFSDEEKKIVIFSIILILLVFAAYIPNFIWISNSFGIIPDIRYLAPIYLPLIILAFFTLKKVNFSDDCILMTFKSFIPLIIIELPLMYIIYQLFSENSLPGQLFMNSIITSVILFVSLVIFLLFLMQKTSINNLAFAVAAIMVSSFSWFLIVGFRFRDIGYEGYGFWIPLVEKIWIISMSQFTILLH